jgi:hypothetical protein
MAVLETISAILTVGSLGATIYFKRYKVKRFIKRQFHMIKLKYRHYKDKKATSKTSVRYMPVSELETVGLKHADNLEDLEKQVIEDEFSLEQTEVIDLQKTNESHNILYGQYQPESNSSIETTETIETIDDAQTFYTAQDMMPMKVDSNSIEI